MSAVNDKKSTKHTTLKMIPQTCSHLAGNGKLYKMLEQIPVPITEAKKTGVKLTTSFSFNMKKSRDSHEGWSSQTKVGLLVLWPSSNRRLPSEKGRICC